MKIRILLIFSFILMALTSCGDKKSHLAPTWNGNNKKYSPLKKSKPKNFDPQIRVSDEMLREMAEHLFILQNNASEELKISEGLSFGATLLHYVGNMGNFTLTADALSKIIKGFEKLIEEPIDEKIMFVLNQIKSISFNKRNGRCRVTIFGKNKDGIVYFINEESNEEGSSLKKIKFFQAKNGSQIELEVVNTVREREELVRFVKDTGKRDSIHRDIPNFIEDYFHLESPAPLIKMHFKDMIVRVSTNTIWKDIDFRFKYGWSIPLFRIGEKKVPGLVLFLKKNLAKVKISIDQ